MGISKEKETNNNTEFSLKGFNSSTAIKWISSEIII